MGLPFGLHWKCPHHPDGCETSGKFSEMATQCRLDEVLWAVYREAMKLVKGPLKKPTNAAKPSAQVSAWMDADFEKQWPYLASWLAETKWDDGTFRETGTLLLFVQDGVLKCCLNDRALNRSCFLSGPTYGCLMDACEAGLEADNLPWREKKPYRGEK